MSLPDRSGPTRPEPTPDFRWERWSLREEGRAAWTRAGAVALLVLGVSVVLLVSLPPATAFVLTLLVAMALVPYFLPRHYRVSEAGLVQTRGFWNARRDWTEFGSFQAGPGGYWLLPAPALTDQVGKFRLKPPPFFLPAPLEPANARTLEFFL